MFPGMVLSERFLNEEIIVWALIGLVLGGQIPRLNRGPICFSVQNNQRDAMGHRRSSATLLLSLLVYY